MSGRGSGQYEARSIWASAAAAAKRVAPPTATRRTASRPRAHIARFSTPEAALQRKPGLKVLFMTGYTPNAIIHNGVLDPGTHLLSKPFAVAQLAEKLRTVLGEATADEKQ